MNQIVTLNTATADLLVATMLFTHDVLVDVLAYGGTEHVIRLAELYGLVSQRPPTPAEIADPDWWGHHHGLTADDKVRALSEKFDGLIKSVGKAA